MAKRQRRLPRVDDISDRSPDDRVERRAVDVGLPLWSANALLTAPQVLRQIHADYLRAGAEIITADTFRTHRRNLVAAGMGHQVMSRSADLEAPAQLRCQAR